ncbi:hypothetical protein BCR32DRAFT_281421 [Anaeromyces robustus]|uniref:Tubby C-terminal domain-containing protein n=1 Tax=Anaeromyces robustus TaxID=1754192 RepID=A0A1Y1X1X5_9FUNG|nr:hypothetical protein BCR32DRAFT_281421 [Anaeromyces robustus]|eukprot:ORX79416.1 hypothetical protein BCR32DRAFT_281421 [Anaeromyces robustus]
MGNSYSLKGQELACPPNEIFLHDKTYVFNKNYTINVKKDIIHEKKRYIFYDKINRIYFLMFKPLPDCKEVYLCDMRNRPVLNLKENREKKTSKIFIKDDDTKFRVKIKFGSDRVKVYFVNKANGKKEILQIKTNRKFTQIGIYYGVFEEDAPLIAKFYLKEKNLQVTKEYNYIYEISAGVDISFMAMLAIFLNRYRIFLSENTSLYDRKEVQPRRRVNTSGSSVSNANTNDSIRSKSSKLSVKDIKLSHFSNNTNSDIGRDPYFSFPQAADNKSSLSSNHSRTSIVE